MTMDYDIRPLRAEEGEFLNALFNATFATHRPISHWHWKFLDNPSDRATLRRIVVAAEHDQLIGQYAGIARDIYIGEKQAHVGEVVDNFIDINHRSASLTIQRRIFELFIQLFLEDGGDFTLGCPNDTAYKVGKRLLKYEDLFSLPRLFYRLNWQLMAQKRLPRALHFVLPVVRTVSALAMSWKIRQSFPKMPSLVIEKVDRFDERIEPLWQTAKERYHILQDRSQKALNWRFADHPDGPYLIWIATQDGRVVGYMTANVMDRAPARIGYILDALFVEEAVCQALLHEVLDYFVTKRVDYALSLAATGSEWARWLRQGGFMERAGMPPVNMVIRFWNNRFPPAIVRESANWHLTFGDFDLEASERMPSP